MTKANSILHRAAALLAALCLLASMALPVYAAETGTEFSVSNSETIPGDDNTGNGADGTGSDISVSNLETSQKDADTTSEGSKTEPEISVPNSETITNSADTTDKAADAPLAEGVTGSENTAPADNAAADKTADADKTGEDSTGSEDEAGFLNEDDSADDRMITAGNTKESDIALCADNATVQEGTKYTFYFAPPKIWEGSLSESSTITCSFKRGNNRDHPNGPTYCEKNTTAKRTDDLTKDGRRIYQVDVYHKQGEETSLCPYGGFVWVKFTLDENHWVQMNGERKNNECWMFVKDIADKCLDGNKLAVSSDETTVSQEYDITKWVDYTSIILKHVRYGKQTMTLLNKSAQALEGVTVTFWEKGDNEVFTQVGDSQTINALQAGEHADITIPEAACAYVSFQKADNTYIGKHYFNFYNDDTASDDVAVFPYDPVTRYCLIYTGDKDVRWSAPGSKTVYFDATFSDMSYNNDAAKIPYGMPDANGSLWCYMTSGESGKEPITKLQMVRDGTSEIWYVDVPQGYTKIRFASWAVDNDIAAQNGDGTAMLTIPTDKDKPCFYADTSDDVIYQGGNRDGYWDVLGATRDAEKGKKTADGSAKNIVELENKTFAPQSNTKYISTTLYDYYTDYELNGNNRNTYSSTETGSHRSYVPFRQFDRALSNYYSSYTGIPKIQNPIYTGHFQPDYSDWGCRFSAIAANLNLYGWGNSSESDNSAYKHFMAVNNSTINTEDDNVNYYAAFQGLVGNQMKDGMPVMAGTDLAEPHFNEAFLTGTNAEKAVLGKVYKDVSFPFTQKPVFKQKDGDSESKAQYWYFDSNERSLYLKQDNANSKYYLEATQTGTSENPIYTDVNSQNRGSNNSTEDNNQSRGYGFFPFNQKITEQNRNVNKYNYGFGAKLQFDFTLTDDGMVQVGDNANDKVPIKFFFSGDDDVWVYIDGQLVLDVGGAHGKASGLLEFGRTTDGTANTVTPYVSSNKAGGIVYEDGAEGKFVYFNGSKVTFDKKGKICDKDGNPFALAKGTTHTLTMFYMERGMWESNMAVAFNFPDHNELQVQKKVDVTGVNELFKDSFQNQKIFTFNIKNLATHYGEKATSYEAGTTQKLPEKAYKDAVGSSDAFASLAYASKPPDSKTGDLAVLWSATRDDPTSAHREQRRGTLPLSTAIDISQYSYLTFDVYVEGEPTETCALGNLYVELWDDQGNQKGCINSKGLQSSDVYGAAIGLHPGQWYTIRLLLNSLKTKGTFNNQLKRITVGDNFARKIYLRNFTFRSAPKEKTKPGFTTEQYDIPDYNSATTGKLENAKYAVFSSDRGNGDVVDENGQFLLQDGETVTFKDQFRRGSYIALQELTDPKLYDTSWTVYENDAPVKEVKGVDSLVTTGSVKTLENVRGTAPDDGRTEKVIGGDKNGHQIENNYVVAQKPDNTLVFRSYSGTADKDELTKLKVVFTNKVKTGKLIIRKEAAPGESLLNETFTFTVKFSNVGGQGLGGDILEKKYDCTVTRQANGQEYGEVEIKGIPVGTRFVVSEVAQNGTNLQLVTITGGGSDRAVVDGIKARGSVVADDTNAATATFVNTKRQLIDLVVTKQWVKQDGTMDIPNNELPAAIYLKLQRTTTPGDPKNWEDVQTVKRLTDSYSGWVTTFTGLDKFDATNTSGNHEYYTYRVLESATETGPFYGDSANNVIKIGGKKYTILNNTVKVEESSTTPLALTLTNQLQDAKYNLNITKQDAEDKTKLGGVEFKLEKLNGDGTVDTTFTAVTKVTSSEDANKGKCSFDNLSPGSYRLTETKTAEGYTLLADAIKFTLTTGGECERDGAGFGDVKPDSTAGVYNIALTINNRKSFELPHTGADAPSLWLLIGLPALVAVLLVLVFRYNKKGGRRQ